MQDVVVLVQARLDSTRFPQKVLAPFLGMPMLAYQVQRLSTAGWRVIVLAPQDNDAIMSLRHYRVSVGQIPGAEADVLGRLAWYARGAISPSALIVRACGDCPLLCPILLDDLVAYWDATPGLAYLGMGSGWPDGLADYDLLTREALLQMDAEATLPSDREHVVPWVWAQKDRLSQQTYPAPEWVRARRWPKLSVDTPEDLAYVERVAQHVTQVYGSTYTWQNILAGLCDEPALQRPPEPMNPAYVAQVAQEQGREGMTWEAVRYHVGRLDRNCT